MPQLYIKICGLSTPESVAAAVEAGADAVGFVFAPGSPRTVDAELAASLGQAVPADVETVGVFRNQPLAEVMDIATRAAVSTVQLHGDEPLDDIRALQARGFQDAAGLLRRRVRGAAGSGTSAVGRGTHPDRRRGAGGRCHL